MAKWIIKLFSFVITISLIISSISISHSSSHSNVSDLHLLHGVTSATNSDSYVIINLDNTDRKFNRFSIKVITQLMKKFLSQNQDNITVDGPPNQFPITKIAMGISLDEFYEPLSIQILMYLPSSRDKLSRIASGNFSFDTVWSAVTGVQEKTDNKSKAETSSIKGVYLTEDIAVAVVPESDILILGLTPEDVSDAIDGIRGKKFAGIARRFDEKDFGLFQMTVKNMFDPYSEPLPVKTEYAFSEKPYGFDIKQWSNLYELFPDLDKKSPVHAGPVPLFGKGQPYFFTHTALETDIFKSIVKLLGLDWEDLTQILSELLLDEYDITVKDIENLISNSISVVYGVDANLMGTEFPGFYIYFGGSDNSAEKLIKAIEDYFNEQGLLKHAEITGWDTVLTTAEHIPVSITIGQKGDNLIVGLMNPESLTDRPELNEKIKGIISESGYVAYSYMDFELFWSELRNQFLYNGLIPLLFEMGLSQNVFNAILELLDTDPPVKSLISRSKRFDMAEIQIEINEKDDPFIEAFTELIYQLLQNQSEEDSLLYE